MNSVDVVGRERETALLTPGGWPPGRRCVYVHGPGGIGKSALLAAAAGAGDGPVELIDGREPSGADARIAAATTGLLVVDTLEEAPALEPLLLERIASGGPRVVVASRRPPGPRWTAAIVEPYVLELALGPLATEAGHALLAARGVPAGRHAPILAWAAGHPLSLAVAADLVVGTERLDLDRLHDDQTLAETLLRRLAGTELDGADHEVLAVAATARAVDARLLESVLDGIDGDQAEAWLRTLSFAEPLGTRVALHARLRGALATALAAQDPLTDRERRRRIIMHVSERFAAGELWQLLDLGALAADPAVRWAIAPPQMTYSVGPPRAGDREIIAAQLGSEPWWPATQRWFDEAPARTSVIRDADGALRGWAIAMTPATAPAWAHEDPVAGPWLAHARAAGLGDDVAFMRDSGELPPPPAGTPIASEIVSAGNAYVVLEAGRILRYAYVTIDDDDDGTRELMVALGYHEVPELAIDDGRRRATFTTDWGEGGAARAMRDLVLSSNGIEPPQSPPRRQILDRAAVRTALRSFHDPVALAASPLADGAAGVGERASVVRERLGAAIEAAFGPDDRELRDVIRLGYLDPDVGHTRAALDLHLSRATYFRRLGQAVARVAQELI